MTPTVAGINWIHTPIRLHMDAMKVIMGMQDLLVVQGKKRVSSKAQRRGTDYTTEYSALVVHGNFGNVVSTRLS